MENVLRYKKPEIRAHIVMCLASTNVLFGRFFFGINAKIANSKTTENDLIIWFLLKIIEYFVGLCYNIILFTFWPIFTFLTVVA